ncbi:hypothetical protein BJ875DRAFT_438474 [Amylocarpus encephaloides]|uniref:Uncharacterized protein n=1 Tax=Amylocarpus encephaloides TaxID=45428 RepID=A0A9P8C828_9HELO|nr:hypothetical protein BJ875DRAFT_438474 [Amylocarpus encephaloides]
MALPLDTLFGKPPYSPSSSRYSPRRKITKKNLQNQQVVEYGRSLKTAKEIYITTEKPRERKSKRNGIKPQRVTRSIDHRSRKVLFKHIKKPKSTKSPSRALEDDAWVDLPKVTFCEVTSDGTKLSKARATLMDCESELLVSLEKYSEICKMLDDLRNCIQNSLLEDAKRVNLLAYITNRIKYLEAITDFQECQLRATRHYSKLGDLDKWLKVHKKSLPWTSRYGRLAKLRSGRRYLLKDTDG